MNSLKFYWDQPFLIDWVGWDFSCSIRAENRFRLVSQLIDFSKRRQTRLKQLKKLLRDYVA